MHDRDGTMHHHDVYHVSYAFKYHDIFGIPTLGQAAFSKEYSQKWGRIEALC